MIPPLTGNESVCCSNDPPVAVESSANIEARRSWRPVETRRSLLPPARQQPAASLRGVARLLRRRPARLAGGRPLRLLHRLGPPDGHPATRGQAQAVRPHQTRPQGTGRPSAVSAWAISVTLWSPP